MMDEYDNGGTLPPGQPVRNGTGKPEPVYNPAAHQGRAALHPRAVRQEGDGMTGSLLWTVLIVLVIIALLLFILRGRL